MHARYRRVATPAADGFPGFPELAHGIAAASGSKVYTDQVWLLSDIVKNFCAAHRLDCQTETVRACIGCQPFASWAPRTWTAVDTSTTRSGARGNSMVGRWCIRAWRVTASSGCYVSTCAPTFSSWAAAGTTSARASHRRDWTLRSRYRKWPIYAMGSTTLRNMLQQWCSFGDEPHEPAFACRTTCNAL